MSWTAVAQSAQIITPFILSASATAGWLAISANIKISRFNKRSDIIMHCNLRYDQIYQLKTNIISHETIANGIVNDYYSRYWGLKSDQFDYWLSDLVDPDTFVSWFYSTAKSFQENSYIGGMSFEQGWIKIGQQNNRHVNFLFNSFIIKIIDMVRNNQNFDVFDIVSILEKLEIKTKSWRNKIIKGMNLKYYKKSLLNLRDF